MIRKMLLFAGMPALVSAALLFSASSADAQGKGGGGRGGGGGRPGGGARPGGSGPRPGGTVPRPGGTSYRPVNPGGSSTWYRGGYYPYANRWGSGFGIYLGFGFPWGGYG